MKREIGGGIWVDRKRIRKRMLVRNKEIVIRSQEGIVRINQVEIKGRGIKVEERDLPRKMGINREVERIDQGEMERADRRMIRVFSIEDRR